MNIADTNIPAWEGFVGGQWQKDIDTAVFVRLNYTPYEDGPEFLADATPATEALWNKLQSLQKEERAKGGVLDMDTDVVSSITSHAPIMVGSLSLPLCRRLAKCISSNISRLSLEAVPSVPNATFTP